MLKIISVVGARPNFMKIAPFIRAIEAHNIKEGKAADRKINHLLVHTGQHYDFQMNRLFFKELEIPEPDINLGIGSGTHAEQVGKTMIAFEKVLRQHNPDWVVIVGDVNATLACSITAKKEHVKCCHIEAGIRSGDLTMPEEINRLVADRLSDLLLTPHRVADENLKREGVLGENICFVGNIMIDSLEFNRQKAKALSLGQIVSRNYIRSGFDFLGKKSCASDFQAADKSYCVVTLHRPSNVDKRDVLSNLVEFIISEASKDLQVIWPLHPRAIKRLKEFKLWKDVRNCRKLFLTQSLGYLEMLRLSMGARAMFTDSGSLQGECDVLGIPCLTIRWNTEWPVTLAEHGGTNLLAGNDIKLIRECYKKALVRQNSPHRPELWDGNTAPRCLEAIISYRQG